MLLSQQQVKEIRAYAANEIFKTRKLTNKLFSEFEQVKKMREDVRNTNYQISANVVSDRDAEGKKMQDSIGKRTKQMERQLDTQFNALRIQMRRVQVKHDRLRQLKEELRRLQRWLELGYEGNGASIGVQGAGGIR